MNLTIPFFSFVFFGGFLTFFFLTVAFLGVCLFSDLPDF